jgi:flagellar hook-basal body complex protein FliE
MKVESTNMTVLNNSLADVKQQVLLAKNSAQAPSKSNGPTFSERLTNGLKDVAESQNSAAKLAQDYELGVENDLSKVMVTQQVSSLGFQLTLNIRNKALSAYKDIMNMPV